MEGFWEEEGPQILGRLGEGKEERKRLIVISDLELGNGNFLVFQGLEREMEASNTKVREG